VLSPFPSLADLGWDAERAGAFVAWSQVGCNPGRVTRVDRGSATVMTDAGPLRLPSGAPVGSGHVHIAVGDWVVVDPAASQILEVLPRRGCVTRAAAGKETAAQVVAANVDLVLILAIAEAPNLRRLERSLALAWQTGGVPVIVLTKSDTCGNPEESLLAVTEATLGVDIIAASSIDGMGIQTIRALIGPGRSAVLLGPSGVGKSTLLNCLVGSDVAATAEVREDGRGRHTTTFRQLVLLPGGGIVIDTPGIREIGLWEAVEGVDQVFADVSEAAAGCRFSDCRHEREPGCAVVAALQAGTLTADRVTSWKKLQRELHHQATRIDARKAIEERRRWKGITRANRERERGRRGR
jgi:ribosome biogenesis GTPase / thiamine phosphate phosphatase